ncbi:MAG: hypothetical protein AB7K52_01850 [Phycisphaerales bacterium]
MNIARLTRIAGVIASLGFAGAAQAQLLTQNQVEDVVRRAIDAANARGINATISVVDREGNILACVRMTDTTSLDGTGVPRTVPNTSVLNAGGAGGLDPGPLSVFYDPPANTIPLFVPNMGGARVATSLTATTKAGTAAFLSTSGNAFSTRTAAFIIQSNFPPGTRLQPSGPLYGVQFSSLPNSDFNRLPLGLSGDSGGLPLYDAAGQCRGGVGIECNDTRTAATGTYTVDTTRAFGTPSTEELIALAAQGAGAAGHAPPRHIMASMVLLTGLRLAYAYANPPFVTAFAPGSSNAFIAGEAGAGRLQILVAPTGSPGASMFTQVPLTDPLGGPPAQIGGVNGATVDGYHAAGALQTFDGVVVDPDGVGPVAPQNLTAADVQRALFQAHSVCNRLRAMIRRDRPLICQVNVSVIDTDGNLLGFYRSFDAPVFGMDVSLQKARSALFFSRPEAAALLGQAEPDHPLDPAGAETIYDKYVNAASGFGLNLDGSVAFGVRTIGFLSRTNIPDAIFATRRGATPRGPFGTFGPIPGGGGAEFRFSPFNTGIQTDLFTLNLVRFLLTYGPGGDVNEAQRLMDFNANRSGNRPLANAPLGAMFAATVPGRVSRGPALNPGELDEPAPLGFPARTLANGLQIFSGGVPMYKLDPVTNTAVLVGAVGVSGDGIEQDDMIAFAGSGGFVPRTLGDFQRFGSNVRRADFVLLQGVRFLRLPYVKYPRAPFAGL